MPFGSADRARLEQIAAQLKNLATDLATLKQQVENQQHAISQIREQDATAAINSGLADIRAVARSALDRTGEVVTEPLAGIGSELVAIRGAINRLEGRLRTAPPPATEVPEQDPAPVAPPPPPPPAVDDVPPEPAPDPEPRPGPEGEQDLEVLRAAAGISAATLHAHRDTWEFLVKHAGQDQHFHLPAEVQDAAGTILAKVSGPSLVAALTRLHRVSHTAGDAGTRAIAAHLHGRLTETVQEIVTRPHRGDGADPVHVVIDDRAAPAGQDDRGQ
ncbi:hypothetical protein HCJ93_15910 [Streptomyces sp. SBST2-5]|uniref:Uncharacterized protein n=1 Tax=Streptomyces composti TaxID=2720025 RepID=A0ABX1A4Z0_9ACTN|nr:hypothetical protein [Streptomyces composti]NJP51514.1 hypothetical protein [Streptomyces composti]